MGGLVADAFDGGEGGVVAGGDDVDEVSGLEGGEDHAGCVGADAGDGGEEEEEFALFAAGKAVEEVGVFAYDFVDEEGALVASLEGAIGGQ